MESFVETFINMNIRKLSVSLFIILLFSSVEAKPVIREMVGGVEFRNEHVSLLLSDKAELLTCVELRTGKDIAAPDHRIVARAKTLSNTTIYATRLFLTDEILHVVFDKAEVLYKVSANDDYFTFEIVGGDLNSFESIFFLDLRLAYDFTLSNPFLGAGVALSLQTNPIYYPSGESKQVIGQCTAHTGMKGAKMAVVLCCKDELKRILKTIYTSVTPGTVPFSSIGGPFAQDSDYNKSDCLILSGLAPSGIQESIEFYKRWGIQQLDFQRGPHTFIQGDFSFPESGSAAVFKEQITDPLRNAGIFSSLHTYSFYIGYDSKELLSDVRWQQQLEFRESFTLQKTISASVTEIDLRGDRASLKDNSSFWSIHSPYVLIDNEIIKYAIGRNGLVSCKRGQCGTIAVEHKLGAEVRIIGGYYSHIAPKPGSDLFYEIARRTARAYNDGGFRGFYFDAFDGLAVHLKHAGLGDYTWYYGAAFINEVLKNCKEPPLVEYSTLYPTLWAARGRGGAWDTPNRGYKNWIDDHTESNKSLIDRLYVPTLGWYNFNPVSKTLPRNFSTKYMFFDDVDYLGVKAIAFDQTIVYNGLKESDIINTPSMRRNMDNYSRYSSLRINDYFSDKVKSILRRGNYEYHLVKKSGRWRFQEAVYCRAKLRDINLYSLTDINPFRRQKPFVRIENLYTSDCHSAIPLLQFNEKLDIVGQSCIKVFSSPLNLSNHLAIRIIIRGNGKSSRDALCIRLRSSISSGYSDYVVKTNFDGWRDVVLADLDNAENPDLIFVGMEDENYRMHRQTVDYSKIESVQVFMAGECAGVRVQSIDAVSLATNALSNPTVSIGLSSVTFNDSLQSGEYLEYFANEGYATIYDENGVSRTVDITKQGRFTVPRGLFQARVDGTPELDSSPSQVVLTIGLYGKFVR